MCFFFFNQDFMNLTWIIREIICSLKHLFKIPFLSSLRYRKKLVLKGTQNESREGNGTPLQYSCLENPMDGGAWQAVVHRVAKSRTWLSDFTFTFHFHTLEKAMATHSSVLAWRIAGIGEPGGLPSMGSLRVRHDWSDLAVIWKIAWVWATIYQSLKEFAFSMFMFQLRLLNTTQYRL